MIKYISNVQRLSYEECKHCAFENTALIVRQNFLHNHFKPLDLFDRKMDDKFAFLKPLF